MWYFLEIICKNGYRWLLLLALCLQGCEDPSLPFDLQAVTFAELPGFQTEPLQEAWPVFMRSCEKIISLPQDFVFLNGQKAAPWAQVCQKAHSENPLTAVQIKQFFQSHFTPYRVSALGKKTGLFTGYYEPQVLGSLSPSQEYTVPLYKRPADLVLVENLFVLRPDKPDYKGVRIAGRLQDGSLKPYYSRAEIENSRVLKGQELVWLADPIDAFFVQVQGSATVMLPSGKTLRLAYAGTNGHPYTSLGSVMLAKKLLIKDEITMQSIRAWLKNNISEARALMQHNASFVFFKIIDGPGPLGGQDLILTPGRSLAIDPAFIAYGTPLWLTIQGDAHQPALQRLVIAQDKGGAIKGGIRGDLFWGTGADAASKAGKMKATGTYYVLLPKK